MYGLMLRKATLTSQASAIAPRGQKSFQIPLAVDRTGAHVEFAAERPFRSGSETPSLPLPSARTHEAVRCLIGREDGRTPDSTPRHTNVTFLLNIAPAIGARLPPDPAGSRRSFYDPGRLAEWTGFHAQVEALPEEEREVFDLLFYQGVPQAEAAAVLGVSERTIKRRWQAARLALHEALGGRLPGV